METSWPVFTRVGTQWSELVRATSQQNPLWVSPQIMQLPRIYAKIDKRSELLDTFCDRMMILQVVPMPLIFSLMSVKLLSELIRLVDVTPTKKQIYLFDVYTM